MVLIKEYGKQLRLYNNNQIVIKKIKKNLNLIKKINKDFLLTQTQAEILKINNDLLSTAICFYSFYIPENKNKNYMKIDFKNYMKLIHMKKKQDIEINDLREESKKHLVEKNNLCLEVISFKNRSWFEINFPNAYINWFNFMSRILPSF
jgi:hypothetical protein